ncbi:hypothetical protein Tco_1060302 [Tanacetum coccineum]
MPSLIPNSTLCMLAVERPDARNVNIFSGEAITKFQQAIHMAREGKASNSYAPVQGRTSADISGGGVWRNAIPNDGYTDILGNNEDQLSLKAFLISSMNAIGVNSLFSTRLQNSRDLRLLALFCAFLILGHSPL